MDQELQRIFQALLQCVENHHKGDENKEWFGRLIQNSLNGMTNHETDLDLIYNAIVIENILANLLAIDIKIIVKVRMIHKIINTLWEENKWDSNLLNNYILENKPELQENLQNNQELINTAYNAPTNIKEHQIIMEELPILEIKMTEKNPEISPITSDSIEFQTTFQSFENSKSNRGNVLMDFVEKDISEVSRYKFTSRRFEPLNLFYVTKNNTYLLEVLAVNVSGKNSKLLLQVA